MATVDNIRRHREAKGLTQARLTDAVVLAEGAIRHYEGGIRAVKPKLLEGIAKAFEVSVGVRKDYGVETSRGLMALPLRLEEGYGLVPDKNGMGLAVDPKAPHAPKLAQPIRPRAEERAEPECGELDEAATPIGRPRSDIFPGKLMLHCEQPPVFRRPLLYSHMKSTPWKPR